MRIKDNYIEVIFALWLTTVAAILFSNYPRGKNNVIVGEITLLFAHLKVLNLIITIVVAVLPGIISSVISRGNCVTWICCSYSIVY